MLHALMSAKKYGGKPEDYIEVHDFIDSSKAHFPDVRHRSLLHSSFGIYLCEKIYGHNIKLSNGEVAQVRDVAEDHIISDLGFIPTVQDYLDLMKLEKWMGGRQVKGSKKTFKFNLLKGEIK